MKIDTTYLARCIQTLTKAHQLLLEADKTSIDYGEHFAEETLKLRSQFINDADDLEQKIRTYSIDD